MRVSRAAMARHHEEIVGKAVVLLKERGIDGLSVADLMEAAGLTHGGFYRHFASKEALVAEATRAAFDEIVSRLDTDTEAKCAREAVAEYVDRYLSLSHVERPAIGCPIAAYGTDVGRQSDVVRSAFADGLEGLCRRIAACLHAHHRDAQACARQLVMTMAGAVVTARAAGDQTLAKSILIDARAVAEELIANAP